MIPLPALAMRQLHAAGKVSERESTSMALFFGAVFLLKASASRFENFARLQPQQRRPAALLTELAEEAS